MNRTAESLAIIIARLEDWQNSERNRKVIEKTCGQSTINSAKSRLLECLRKLGAE